MANVDVLLLASGETEPLVAILKADADNRVFVARTAGEFLQELLRRPIDVSVIADRGEMVEGVDLLSVVSRMSSTAIFVVGEGGQDRIASALLQGADAYLTVPVSPAELRGRLHAVLWRQRPRGRDGSGNGNGHGSGNGSNGSGTAQGTKPQRFSAWLSEDELRFMLDQLTNVEKKLFTALYNQDGAVVASDRLATTVWGSELKNAALRFYIRRLRSKLEAHGLLRIVSRKGFGYQIAFGGLRPSAN
jgi:DNA-binding response OmpR family regulator